MDHDPLWNLARDRMLELQRESAAQRALGDMRVGRTRRLTLILALARVLCALGRRLVSLGRRLECYEMRLLRQT